MRQDLHRHLTIAGLTDRGAVRDNNEDYIDWDEKLGLLVLADGMGGAKAGEVASQLAVRTIMEQVRRESAASKEGLHETADGQEYTRASHILMEALRAAHQTVTQVADSQPQYQGMGTTVVACLCYDNRVSIAHVGDSRLYLFRQHQLRQVTEDHTLIQELVRRGFYRPQEAQKSVNRNMLTQAVGVSESLQVSIQEETLLVDDLLLLCSDGLTDMLDDRDISRLLQKIREPAEAASQLVELANQAGGKDNISVLLMRIDSPFPAGPRHWGKRILDWFFS
jgi:protein phosphatase